MSFLNQKVNQESSRVERFIKMVEDASKVEVRKIEMHLLTPIPFPEYSGPDPRKSEFKARSVKFVFPTIEDVDLVRKHLHVSSYIENNTADVGMLLALLKGIENGTYLWNTKKKIITVNKKKRKEMKIGKRIRRNNKRRTSICVSKQRLHLEKRKKD